MKDPVRRSLSPKSILQMQLETAEAQGADFWACPRCGCRDWRVRDSRLEDGNEPRKRQRVCRNCNGILPTQELPVPKGFKLVIVPESLQVERPQE